MGESSSSSRKRRRDSNASRSRSRSRPRKSSGSGSSKPSSRRHKSKSRSRERERDRESRHRRSSHKSGSGRSSRKRSASLSSDASSRSRSRSRSASRKSKEKSKGKDHKRRSRRSSSVSERERHDKKRDKEKKHSSKNKDERRRRRSRSRSRSRSPHKKNVEEDEKQERKSSETKQELSVKSDRRQERSRSRSRGRGVVTSSVPSSTESQEAKKPVKSFSFTGISLKSDKKLAVKPVAMAPTSILSGTSGTSASTSNGDDEKQRRREKLKLWREQQLKQTPQDSEQKAPATQAATKQQLVNRFLADDDAVPKRVQLWSLDTNGEEKEPESTEEAKKKHEAQRQREQQVVDEVDPLDAYMAGLVDEAAIQQSIVNPLANVISLDEIQSRDKLNIYGTFLPPGHDNESVPEPTAVQAVAAVAATTVQSTPTAKQETEQEREAREERELQEFMRAFREKRDQEQTEEKADDDAETAESLTATKKDDTGRIFQGFDEDVIGEEARHIDQRSALEILQEAQKKKEIQAVDHSQVDYIPFQKKFYVVPKEIKDASEEEIQVIRDELEIKVRGKNCPRPLDKWTQCGFSVRMLQLIQKHGYTEPFAIQRQALPAIMSGRDVIGIAKTGSGKTLAFLLPMFRHILHQPPLKEGEGPIGLIMAPARELAQQIYMEAKRFAKGLGMRATAVYGGSSVSEQIANLKRGSDVVICTPGRMIDILCMSAGKMVSLKRVTYVVLDEADRMFDMGFEPQITKIMLNVRPDRQTLLFSATFPKAVETLARKVLKKPVEITVGGRSQASGDITQYVEVRDDKDKFMRLLQLLGLWYEKGNVLVFVNTQQACDQLFQDLMKAGYPALSLHGGKDQVDRDFTVDDFKRKVRTLMVATSVAGRGLDVKDLVLVINYHCPNHLEDYVHRVGRTGRAGRKGTAYTFISPDEEEYSVDLVKALESGKQVIPPELTALAEAFKERVRKGEARYHGSGFKGKGFTFDESEKNETQRVADLQKRQYELSEGIVVENHDASDDEADAPDDAAPKSTQSGAAAASAATPAAAAVAAASGVPLDSEALSAMRKAQQIAQILDRQYKHNQSGPSGSAGSGATVFDEGHFEEELEINDYPQQARWKVTQKEATERVSELTGVAVITRGSYVPAGRKPNPGERKLYLAIEGPTPVAVLEARRELQRILDETTMQVGLGNDRYGKYNL